MQNRAVGVYFCPRVCGCVCVKGRIVDDTEFLCESICACVCVEHMFGCVIRGRVRLV